MFEQIEFETYFRYTHTHTQINIFPLCAYHDIVYERRKNEPLNRACCTISNHSEFPFFEMHNFVRVETRPLWHRKGQICYLKFYLLFVSSLSIYQFIGRLVVPSSIFFDFFFHSFLNFIFVYLLFFNLPSVWFYGMVFVLHSTKHTIDKVFLKNLLCVLCRIQAKLLPLPLFMNSKTKILFYPRF